MRALHSQAGIGHIVVVLVLLVVGVVGFAGYKVASKNTQGSNDASATASPEVPDKISTKADLETTGKALDNSSTQIDGGLNDSALDDDLNDML
ncbi:MAG: hypothetical protein JWP13_794 [Candidatus Saccharibacteria bacterium]|nr:hypothetical protein [Candidatus Saccharibacteria bacterium]